MSKGEIKIRLKEDVNKNMRTRFYVRHVKRILDVFFASLLFVIMIPFLLLCCIIVKCDSKGPVIFKQRRCGADDEMFMIYKFRTMYMDTPKNTPTAMLRNPDIYITKSGKWMRKLSIDEIPQLVNIIKGDMSIIGPRPLVPNEFEMHEDRRAHGASWLKPGLTGWAQINGRDKLNDSQKGKLDGEYARCICFATDFKILLYTLPYVLSSQDVREGVPEKLGNDEHDTIH